MFTNDNTECSTKVTVISQNKFDKWLEKQPTFIRNWCLSNNFKGENSKILKIPYPDGRLKEVLICLLYTSPSPRDVEESRMPSSA